MFTTGGFLSSNPEVLLEYFTKIFNELFSRMGIDAKINVVIATAESEFSSSEIGKCVTQVHIVDAQRKYKQITEKINEVLPSGCNKSEEHKQIKKITIDTLRKLHAEVDNHDYYFHVCENRELKKRKNSSGQQFIHRIVLVECNKKILNDYDDKHFFKMVMESIQYWYFNDKSNYIDELLVKSGRQLLDEKISKIISNITDQNTPPTILHTLNNLSLIKYEGGENTGKILFCDDEKIKGGIILEEGVELTEYRAVRKLLEISQDDLYLICDGYKIIGFIEEKNNLAELINSFIVRFNGLGQWEVEQKNGTRIISVSYGVPKLPKISISEGDFSQKFERVFGIKSYKNVWALIDSAKEQKHGTMIVITDDALGESNRLRKQCFPIKYQSEINSGNIKDLTSIDGALLLDIHGVCYAIGVILDGEVKTNIGDMSRGARYNSALKYLNASKGKRKCLIVIISEDGMIDIRTEEDLVEVLK
ncbi:hypothetical protein CN606_17800 [Bacillus toyonensis]|uniref:diadenylate cyclase n=1 Tax=Bacillus toyonensis TaxID=155322 RepID=UPI000BEFBE63|nr:diadenylate cyclase [Bacillus toyonensis]PEL01348.1 hypothetical protein CN606_17800 [Bacillus toyonensis]